MLANAKRSISRYPARGAEVSLISKMIIYSTYEVARPADIRLALFASCLVPVRRFPSPSRSIRFGDVSEANGRETFSHGPRDPKRFGREEKWGLGTRQVCVNKSTTRMSDDFVRAMNHARKKNSGSRVSKDHKFRKLTFFGYLAFLLQPLQQL